MTFMRRHEPFVCLIFHRHKSVGLRYSMFYHDPHQDYHNELIVQTVK